MNQDDFKVFVSFRGCQYPFDYASQAYIFQSGIYNGFYEKYGIDALLRYIDFVHECYLKDDNHTSPGVLADYVAENWNAVKKKSARGVLSTFYACCF